MMFVQFEELFFRRTINYKGKWWQE